jgi:hypothetical protein
LGGSGKLLTSAENLDDITANGSYWWYDSRPAGALYNYCYMRVDSGEKSLKEYVTQTIWRSGGNGTIVRYNKSGEWVEEWDNPPMQLGVEYRTTEKWGGNTVYAKCVSGGSWLDQKTINIPVDNCYRVTRFEAVAGDYCLPFIYNKNLNGNYTAYVRVSRTSTSNIEVKMCGGLDGNAGTYATVVTVFYVKNE